jgi:hypothetical protein
MGVIDLISLLAVGDGASDEHTAMIGKQATKKPSP